MNRAPGSLFLSGEYAVLVGARAIVSAVNRYAIVTETDGRYSVIGLDDVDLALPHAVCDTIGVDHQMIDGLTIDLDTFYVAGTKLGLSSSAASVVALTRQLGSRHVEEDAFRAHSLFQKKSGSGADIKLAARGGTWAVGAHEVTSPFPTLFQPPDDQTVSIPESIRIEAVWLGQPASTTSFVSSVAESLDDQRVIDVLSKLGELSEVLFLDFSNNEPTKIVSTIDQIDRRLQTLGDLSNTPIVVDAHRELRDAVPDRFAVKPSGAGGGDFSLVVGPRDADWDFGVPFTDLQFDAPL